MRPHGAVINREVADYRALGFTEAVIALRRHPFSLQVPEKPPHRRVILAFSGQDSSEFLRVRFRRVCIRAPALSSAFGPANVPF